MDDLEPDSQNNGGQADQRRERMQLGRGQLWAADLALYRMWFEYLSCSPTYEAARRFHAGDLRDEEIAALPSDFDRVLRCYDDLGDVSSTTFNDWWSERAIKYFGVESTLPLVSAIGPAHEDVSELTLAERRKRRWLEREKGWARQTSQILAFSTALKRRDVLRKIRQELAGIEFEKKPIDERKALYPLQKVGKMRSALKKYKITLRNRSRYQDEDLWSVGVRSKVTLTADKWPWVDGKPVRLGDRDCQIMAIATSRALLRAKMICENAARGIFPSHAKLETAAEKFDFEKISAVFNRIEEMCEKERKFDEDLKDNLEALFNQYGLETRR